LTANQLDFKTTACSQAVAMYRTLKELKRVVPACDYHCLTQDFYAGKHDLVLSGEWAIADAKSALGENLGVAPLPTWQGKPMTSPFATHAIFFPKKITEPMRKIAAFMQSSDFQRRYRDIASRIPTHTKLGTRIPNTAPIPRDAIMVKFWPSAYRGLQKLDTGSPEAVCQVMQEFSKRSVY
jgi:maltose-binding protein MalE